MNFSCPHCGNETFKAFSELKELDNFIGLPCSNCGYLITENDVRKQAIVLAEQLTRDTLKRVGLIK